MKAKRLITIAVVSMLLIGGVAALGAAAPADQANHNATDAEENVPDDAGDAADDRADNASVGPSDGLPSQVPDHVGEVHDRIESFLSGSVDTLGESLSELLGGGEPANDASDDAIEAAGNGADA